MRHLRRTVLAALAVTLCSAPVANAHDPHQGRGGGVVTPSNDRVLNRVWSLFYSLPVAENPWAGPLNGNHCQMVGHKVIQIVGPVTCTVKQGTALALDVGTAWSNAEEPYPADEAAQRALAVASDEAILAFRVSVDGGHSINVRRPRFELFPPQQTVQLPADNILGLPAQAITFTAHAWAAIVRNLRPGRHTIVGEAVFADGTFASPHTLNVVRRGRAGD